MNGFDSTRSLGVQILGMFQALHADLWGTLQALKDGGYDYLEVISDWGTDPAVLAKYKALSGGLDPGWSRDRLRERLPRLRAMGLDVQGLFVGLDRLPGEAEELAAYCKELGIRYVVVSSQGIGTDPGKCQTFIDRALAAGRVLKASGVDLMIHTHEWDFETIPDASGKEVLLIERLLDGCAEIGARMELDAGWAVYAGVDVPDFVRRMARRIAILHVKDISKDFKTIDRSRIFVPAGEGACDYPAILEAALRHCGQDLKIVVDQDPSDRDTLADNLRTAAFLKRWTDA